MLYIAKKKAIKKKKKTLMENIFSFLEIGEFPQRIISKDITKYDWDLEVYRLL